MTFEGGGAEKRSCFFSQKIESSKKIFSKAKEQQNKGKAQEWKPMNHCLLLIPFL
jgi:hypothetical protein